MYYKNVIGFPPVPAAPIAFPLIDVSHLHALEEVGYSFAYETSLYDVAMPTLDEIESQLWFCDVVEQWLATEKWRMDLYERIVQS